MNLSNQKFGKLTAIEYSQGKWRCICECGNTTYVTSYKLRSGHTVSCGCVRKKVAIENGKKSAKRVSETHIIHGSTPKKLYRCWLAMKSRCNNPNNNRYATYGGRGIKVCKEWNESYETFRDWAFQNGWKEELTIDRLNSDGNYEPSNCRWSSQKEQQNNRRDTIMITYQNKTQSLHFWCEEYNQPYHRVYQRMKKLGWTFEKAIGL